jgi:hypothetical protein
MSAVLSYFHSEEKIFMFLYTRITNETSVYIYLFKKSLATELMGPT